MNRTTLRKKLQADQRWVQKAIVSLDDNGRWQQEHEARGRYLAGWIRQGRNLSGRFVEEARKLVLDHYVDDLLRIVLKKSRERIVQLEKDLARERAVVADIEESLSKLPFDESNDFPYRSVPPRPRSDKRKNRLEVKIPDTGKLIGGKTISEICSEEGLY